MKLGGTRDEIQRRKRSNTLADFLDGHVGSLVESGEKRPGGARMSEKRGKKFAEGLAKHGEQ